MAGGQTFCIPTFVTVPPPTGAKSHDTGAKLPLIVLLGGVVVCADAILG
jgi:hypothetical protein